MGGTPSSLTVFGNVVLTISEIHTCDARAPVSRRSKRLSYISVALSHPHVKDVRAEAQQKDDRGDVVESEGARA